MDLSEVTPNLNRHPWEMSRADFLFAVLNRHSHLNPGAELLDVGAGDLFFSEKVNNKTGVRIDAVDSAFDEEGPRNEAIQKIKYLDSVLHKRYDAICALDVLEHVEDDREFFNLLLHMLKPGANLLITVPAFQFLFTQHDFNLRHFRRYSLSRIKKLVNQSEQFEYREQFYFFHTLFFVRALEKLGSFLSRKGNTLSSGKASVAELKSSFKSINQWQFAEHHPLTKSLGLMLSLDARLCRTLSRFKLILPGLSLCVVIQRKN